MALCGSFRSSARQWVTHKSHGRRPDAHGHRQDPILRRGLTECPKAIAADADEDPVAVSCRVLKLSRQPSFRRLVAPVTTAELTAAYRRMPHSIFNANRDDSESSDTGSSPTKQSGSKNPMSERTAWPQPKIRAAGHDDLVQRSSPPTDRTASG